MTSNDPSRSRLSRSTSNETLISPTSTPPVTSRYGSIHPRTATSHSQFDSLQTLLEQAGYKETRVFTPITNKFSNNDHGESRVRSELKGKAKEMNNNKRLDGGALRSDASGSNNLASLRAVRDAKASLEGSKRETKNKVIQEEKGWISRWATWGSGSTAASKTAAVAAAAAARSSIDDQRNSASMDSELSDSSIIVHAGKARSSPPGSAAVSPTKPRAATTRESKAKRHSNALGLKRLEDRFTAVDNGNHSLASHTENQQPLKQQGGDRLVKSSTESTNTRSPRKGRGHQKTASISRADRANKENQDENTHFSSATSSDSRTKSYSIFHSTSTAVSNASPSVSSNHASSTTNAAAQAPPTRPKTKRTATKNDLWLATIAHHTSTSTKENAEKNAKGDSSGSASQALNSKSLPARKKKRDSVDLRKMFERESKESKATSTSESASTTSKRRSLGGLKRMSIQTTVSSPIRPISKRASDPRSPPVTVSKSDPVEPHKGKDRRNSQQSTRSSLDRSIGSTRTLLRGGAGLSLGLTNRKSSDSLREAFLKEKTSGAEKGGQNATEDDVFSPIKKTKLKRLSMERARSNHSPEVCTPPSKLKRTSSKTKKQGWRTSLSEAGFKGFKSLYGEAKEKAGVRESISLGKESNGIEPAILIGDDGVREGEQKSESRLLQPQRRSPASQIKERKDLEKSQELPVSSSPASTDNSVTDAEEEEVISPIKSPVLIPLRLLSSKPAAPILSDRAAVALRNSECLNLRPQLGFGSVAIVGRRNEDLGRQSVGAQRIEGDASTRAGSGPRRMGSIETLRMALKASKKEREKSVNVELPAPAAVVGQMDPQPQVSSPPPTFSKEVQRISSLVDNSVSEQAKLSTSIPISISASSFSSDRPISSPPTLLVTSPRGVTSPKVLDLASSEFAPMSFSPDTLLNKEMKVRYGTPLKGKKRSGSKIPKRVERQRSDGDASLVEKKADTSTIHKTGTARQTSEKSKRSPVKSKRYSAAKKLAESVGNEQIDDVSRPKIQTTQIRNRGGVAPSSTTSSSSSIYKPERGRQLFSLESSSITRTARDSSSISGASTSSSVSTKSELSASQQIHKLSKELDERKVKKKTSSNSIVPVAAAEGLGSSSDPFRDDGGRRVGSIKDGWKYGTLPGSAEEFNTSSSSPSKTSPTSSKVRTLSRKSLLDLKKAASKSQTSEGAEATSAQAQSTNLESSSFKSTEPSWPSLSSFKLPTSISNSSIISECNGEISPARLTRRLNRMSKIASKMNELAEGRDVTPDQSLEDLSTGLEGQENGRDQSFERVESPTVVRVAKGRKARK